MYCFVKTDAANMIGKGGADVFGVQVSFSKPPAEDEEARRTIVVSGFKESSSEKLLKSFFQNEKKSGGGEVEAVKIERGKKLQAVVTFKDEAGRILQLSCHL